MQFDYWTFGLQIINFIILVWILKKFLYEPVLKVIERRQAESVKIRTKAKLAAQEAEKDSKYYQERVNKIEKEREQIIAEARITAARAYDKLISEGQDEAARIRELANKDIIRSQNKAKDEILQNALELAVVLARRILKESKEAGINDYFLDQVVNFLKSMPKADFENLQSQLNENTLTIISAEKLKAEVMKKWRKEISGVLGMELELLFKVDESLIAGVKLQFYGGILSFNWNDILEQAKDELIRTGRKE